MFTVAYRSFNKKTPCFSKKGMLKQDIGGYLRNRSTATSVRVKKNTKFILIGLETGRP